MNRRILVLVVVGLLLRLALAPVTAWSPDFGPWAARVQEMAHGVPLYQNLTFSYPPLFAYTIALFTAPVTHLLGASHVAMRVVPFQALSINSQLISADAPHPLFAFAVKLPMILADLGTGLLLVALTRQLGGSERRAELAAAVWFLSPLAIWVGAVHGQLDPIPAFLTVLALAMMWRRQWFGVGLALSLGVLFKIYPIYLVPLATAFAVRDEVSMWPAARPAVRKAAINVGLLAAGLALPMAVFVPALTNSQFMTAVFSRTETSSVGTGLDLWFPTILTGIQGGIASIARGYGVVLIIILYGGMLLILVRAMRIAGRDRQGAQVDAVIGTLALVLLTSPSTNPQFIVWLLPFLVLAWAGGRGYRLVTAGLATIPVLFYIAQWGGNPVALLSPAIAYYSWPLSAQNAAQGLAASLAQVGPFSISLRLWMMFVVAAVTVGTLVIALRPPARPDRVFIPPPR